MGKYFKLSRSGTVTHGSSHGQVKCSSNFKMSVEGKVFLASATNFLECSFRSFRLRAISFSLALAQIAGLQVTDEIFMLNTKFTLHSIDSEKPKPLLIHGDTMMIY